MENSRKTLEDFIKLISDPDHYYSTGIDKPSKKLLFTEKEELYQYYELFKKNELSYKKGDKILMIRTEYAEKLTRHNLFKKVPRTHSIKEFTVDRPIKTTIRKNVWVGDGYEDVSKTDIKVSDDKYVYTIPSGIYSIPVK